MPTPFGPVTISGREENESFWVLLLDGLLGIGVRLDGIGMDLQDQSVRAGRQGRVGEPEVEQRPLARYDALIPA